jgi:hypothetical protein
MLSCVCVLSTRTSLASAFGSACVSDATPNKVSSYVEEYWKPVPRYRVHIRHDQKMNYYFVGCIGSGSSSLSNPELEIQCCLENRLRAWAAIILISGGQQLESHMLPRRRSRCHLFPCKGFGKCRLYLFSSCRVYTVRERCKGY